MRIADVKMPPEGTPIERMSARQRSLRHGIFGSQVVDLRRTADKLQMLDRGRPEGPYKSASRMRRAADRIEALEREVQALKIQLEKAGLVPTESTESRESREN